MLERERALRSFLWAGEGKLYLAPCPIARKSRGEFMRLRTFGETSVGRERGDGHRIWLQPSPGRAPGSGPPG